LDALTTSILLRGLCGRNGLPVSCASLEADLFVAACMCCVHLESEELLVRW
jgi:hypothetical protein